MDRSAIGRSRRGFAPKHRPSRSAAPYPDNLVVRLTEGEVMRSKEVSRAQRAIRNGGDTRYMKRELEAGNRYLIAFLARRGLEYRNGTIGAKGR